MLYIFFSLIFFLAPSKYTSILIHFFQNLFTLFHKWNIFYVYVLSHSSRYFSEAFLKICITKSSKLNRNLFSKFLIRFLSMYMCYFLFAFTFWLSFKQQKKRISSYKRKSYERIIISLPKNIPIHVVKNK